MSLLSDADPRVTGYPGRRLLLFKQQQPFLRWRVFLDTGVLRVSGELDSSHWTLSASVEAKTPPCRGYSTITGGHCKRRPTSRIQVGSSAPIRACMDNEGMEETPYFWVALGREDRKGITKELCEKVVREARYNEPDPVDGRWRYYGYVQLSEREPRWVRVVTDAGALHNAMYDRTFPRRLNRGEFTERR